MSFPELAWQNFRTKCASYFKKRRKNLQKSRKTKKEKEPPTAREVNQGRKRKHRPEAGSFGRLSIVLSREIAIPAICPRRHKFRKHGLYRFHSSQ
jgi:hypothetical protein